MLPAGLSGNCQSGGTIHLELWPSGRHEPTFAANGSCEVVQRFTDLSTPGGLGYPEAETPLQKHSGQKSVLDHGPFAICLAALDLLEDPRASVRIADQLDGTVPAGVAVHAVCLTRAPKPSGLESPRIPIPANSLAK